MSAMGRAFRKVRNSRRFRAAARSARARTPGLVVTVSRSDAMMSRSRPDQYFVAGQAGLEVAERGLAAAGIGTPRRILDLPSGHGRVLRYLLARWPDADVTASEIDPDAVSFCRKTFGVTALQSRDPLWEAEIGGDYDLIFSGSLFTHFDVDYWVPSLTAFAKALSPDGVIVFTAQGEPSLAFLSGSDEYPLLAALLPPRYGLPPDRAAQLVEDVRATGFGFAHYGGREDSPYGASISMPEWVRPRLAEAGLRVVRHETGGWGGHQDAWTVARA